MNQSVESNELFIDGPVESKLITERIRRHSTDKRSGACQIFLGQVRDDEIDEKRVQAIEYTAYKSMAEKEYKSLRTRIFDEYLIRSLTVLHSLGIVEAGQTSLFVLVTAVHREEAIHACRDTIQLIKEKLPIWGKELYGDDRYVWKQNKENE